MTDVYENIKNLDEESRQKFQRSLKDVLESPKDYPEVYSAGVNHVTPNEKMVAEILYKNMFGHD